MLLTALLPRAGAPSLSHAAQNLLAAATSPPPWPEQRSTPDSHLARASASLETQHRNPLALSLAFYPEPAEHRRRPA